MYYQTTERTSNLDEKGNEFTRNDTVIPKKLWEKPNMDEKHINDEYGTILSNSDKTLKNN